MNKYTITRLMFPEPADNGGGEVDSTPTANDATPAPPAPAGGEEATPTANGDGYGFADNVTATPPTDNDGGGDEYPWRSRRPMVTATPKGVLYRHVQGTRHCWRRWRQDCPWCCGLLAAEYQGGVQAAEDANKKEWGKNFDANMKQTTAFLENTAKHLGFSADDMRQFFNPQAYRFFNALRMQQGGEQRASGTNATPKTMADTKAELSAAIKEYVTYKNTPGFDPGKARSMADNINNMYGEKVIFF